MPTPLHVALPTHDGRADAITMVTLARDLAGSCGRPVRIHLGEASNIPRARNACLRQAESALETASGPTWLLWVDSDIRLGTDSVPSLARYLRQADEEKTAFTANYRQADGHSTLFLRRTRMAGPALDMTNVERLPDWHPLGMCGFGLLYAPIERGYVFHADDVGEDIHFWLDHEALPLRFAKAIHLRHRKAIFI